MKIFVKNSFYGFMVILLIGLLSVSCIALTWILSVQFLEWIWIPMIVTIVSVLAGWLIMGVMNRICVVQKSDEEID